MIKKDLHIDVSPDNTGDKNLFIHEVGLRSGDSIQTEQTAPSPSEKKFTEGELAFIATLSKKEAINLLSLLELMYLKCGNNNYYGTAYTLAQVLGISYNTLTKHLPSLEKSGLIRYGKNTKHPIKRRFLFKPIKDSIAPLLSVDHRVAKYIRIHAVGIDNKTGARIHLPKTTTWTELKAQIRFQLFKVHIGNQVYHLARANAIKDAVASLDSQTPINGGKAISPKMLRKLKQLRKDGKLDNLLNHKTEIHTGQFHLSRILGCSPASAVTILKKLVALGAITTSVKKTRHPFQPKDESEARMYLKTRHKEGEKQGYYEFWCTLSNTMYIIHGTLINSFNGMEFFNVKKCLASIK